VVDAHDATTAYLLNFPVSVLGSMWIGIGASTVQDLVLPRMRAVASAFYLLVITFVGFALGPYCIGELSDALGDLAAAMRYSLLANLVAAGLLLRGLQTLPRDESTLRARARAAGEPGPIERGVRRTCFYHAGCPDGSALPAVWISGPRRA
jgi:MFS family permease